MFRLILAAAAFCFFTVAPSLADEAPAVRYTLTPVMAHGKLAAIAIELRFKGEADGVTMLDLPNSWGGETELWRGVTDLKVTGGKLGECPDHAHCAITHAPGAAITVTYRIIQDWTGEPTVGPHNPYRPVVQPTYFHLLGDAVFAMPEWDDNTSASFRLGSLPHGWRFASDLEHGTREGHELVLGGISESVLVGGDFRVVSRPAAGGPLRVALRGTWKFSDDHIADQIARIVASHNAFWRDPDDPFLVTILPLKNPNGSSISLGGTGRGNAFAFFATDNGEEVTINQILAHEHIHTWIPRRRPCRDGRSSRLLVVGGLYGFLCLSTPGARRYVDAGELRQCDQ